MVEESEWFRQQAMREVANRRWVALAMERHQRAARSTYDFIDSHLRDAMYQPAKAKAWRALASSLIDGEVLQFGVYKGSSIAELAKLLPNREIHGFDSFQGLPEDWSYTPRGTFDLGGQLSEVTNNVRLHAGWFDSTLPAWLAEFAGPVYYGWENDENRALTEFMAASNAELEFLYYGSTYACCRVASIS